MLVDPDLDHMNETENLIRAALPLGVEPVHSFVSMSEISEYLSRRRTMIALSARRKG